VSRNAVALAWVADQVEHGVSATPATEEDSMQIGYARVSTDDQRLELQRDALRGVGCDKIFEERSSGAGPRLVVREELLHFVRGSDVVIVWRLDRLGRSLRDLIEVVTSLADRGIGLRSLRESLDTTSPAGRLTFHIFGALAEFEADLVRERTCAGLAAARRRGVRLGRPPALAAAQVEMARTLMENPSLTARQVAQQLGVHRATLYRSLGRDLERTGS
jgi:DNA invertase Pin-like site-specific DNA recombinase